MSLTPPDSKAADVQQMTAAQAAKEVRRTVFETVDGKDGAKVLKARKVAVEAAEVLSFADLGTHVVVVTRDGQKFSSADA
ncbi:hypothetical protein ACFX58_03495 [Sphingomonas sp. NCPPB 2930]